MPPNFKKVEKSHQLGLEWSKPAALLEKAKPKEAELTQREPTELIYYLNTKNSCSAYCQLTPSRKDIHLLLNLV